MFNESKIKERFRKHFKLRNIKQKNALLSFTGLTINDHCVTNAPKIRELTNLCLTEAPKFNSNKTKRKLSPIFPTVDWEQKGKNQSEDNKKKKNHSLKLSDYFLHTPNFKTKKEKAIFSQVIQKNIKIFKKPKVWANNRLNIYYSENVEELQKYIDNKPHSLIRYRDCDFKVVKHELESSKLKVTNLKKIVDYAYPDYVITKSIITQGNRPEQEINKEINIKANRDRHEKQKKIKFQNMILKPLLIKKCSYNH